MKKREKKRLFFNPGRGENYNIGYLFKTVTNWKRSKAEKMAFDRYLHCVFESKRKGQKPFYFQQQMKKTLEFILK